MKRKSKISKKWSGERTAKPVDPDSGPGPKRLTIPLQDGLLHMKDTEPRQLIRSAQQAINDPEQVLQMTTEEIASGHVSGRELADIHLKRARAFDTLLLEDGREREPSPVEGLGSAMNRDAAIAEYTHVLEFEPANFDAMNRRGELQAERGDVAFDVHEFSAAAKDYERAVADFETMRSHPEGRRHSFVFENLAYCYFRCGQVHAAKGDFVRAIERYDQALPLNTPFGGQTLPIRGCRGDAWRALGKPKRALKDWIAAFQSDGMEEVRRWRGRFKPGSLASSALENGVINQEVRRALAAYAHDRAE